jgi:hypothetical protein
VIARIVDGSFLPSLRPHYGDTMATRRAYEEVENVLLAHPDTEMVVVAASTPGTAG